MLSNVVVKLRERQRDEGVVALLERLLAEARAGEIVGLAVAVHYGGCEYAYAGSGSVVQNSDIGLVMSMRLCDKFRSCGF